MFKKDTSRVLIKKNVSVPVKLYRNKEQPFFITKFLVERCNGKLKFDSLEQYSSNERGVVMNIETLKRRINAVRLDALCEGLSVYYLYIDENAELFYAPISVHSPNDWIARTKVTCQSNDSALANVLANVFEGGC
jgi:hypothetical protein